MAPDTAAGERLPTRHELGAMRIVLRLCAGRPSKGSLRGSYDRIPANGTYGVADFRRAEAALTRLGLLEVDGPFVQLTASGAEASRADEEVFADIAAALVLTIASPVWLGGATKDGFLWPELVPDEELRRLSGLVADADRREALLLAAGVRFDASATTELGLLGEHAVVDACRAFHVRRGAPELAERVMHVSRVSDQLGYDVTSPDTAGAPMRLEVKTTSVPGDAFSIVLSRNEAETGRRDPRWRLVVCRSAGASAVILGTLPMGVLSGRLPRDPETGGQWKTASADVDVRELAPGLPLASETS